MSHFVQIPPDSTGKKIRHEQRHDILFSSSSINLNELQIGDELTNITTNGTGIFTGWDSNTDGTITVFIKNKIGDWNTNNTVISTIGSIGQIVEINDIYTVKQNISDPDNPKHQQKVGPEGSAYIRFSEGVPQLDSFGKLRTSGATLLGAYTISSDSLNLFFVSRLENGATSITNDIQGAQILTNSTDIGSLCIFSSNTYHTYIPGSSYLFLGTFAMDSGKLNLRREWGIFDNSNGFFFREENGVVSAVIRSSSSGSLQEIVINQQNWNGDRVDGTGLSGMDLNITYDNLYWIDVQWLGGGRVRFGVYYNGERVVLHEHYHGNTSSFSLTQSSNLPVRVVQRNLGAVGTSSTIKVWCLALWTETNIDIRTLAIPDQKGFTLTIPSETPVDSILYLGTLSPSPNQPYSGKKNKSIYFPTRFDLLSYDSVTGADIPVEFYAYVDGLISEPTWQPTRLLGSVDYDTTATFYGGGRPVLEKYSKGVSQVDLANIFDSESVGSFKNYAEDGGTIVIPIANITKSSPAVLTFNFPTIYNREGQQMTIFGVSGMSEINGAQVYPKYVSINSVELYTDSGFTTPYDTTTFSNYTNGGFANGMYGERMLFVCAVKKIFNNPNPITVHMTTVWKELIQ